MSRHRFLPHLVLSALLGPLAVADTAMAQARADSGAARRADSSDPFLKQQRKIEEQVRQELEAVDPISRRVMLDYGGWYSFNLFLFDDGIESSRTYRRNDLRVWTRLTLERGAHEIFARARLSYIDFNTGDSYDGNDDDWEGPNLERGYYQFDLRNAAAAYAGKRLPYNVRFKVGRDLVTFGTGYALSTPLDHVQIQTEFSDLQLTGLMGQTVGSANDIDRTRPIERSRRAFFGVEARYLGFERHEPFAYALWQKDHNDDFSPAFQVFSGSTRNLFQKYDFDSFYAGIGSEGELADNLSYSTEWVWESGRSYGDRRFLQKDRIAAWAWDINVEYLFPVRTSPRASLEYMFASGDPDRLFSPTDTLGGNRGDFTNTSFAGFGWRDTGIAFAPVLSNIHVWRGGASFFPFENTRGLERLEIGWDNYLYWKHHREAAVSDFTANVQSGYLGYEADVYANWEITHDLFWTARYGVFFPGSAFDDQTTRTFLLIGVTWSF